MLKETFIFERPKNRLIREFFLEKFHILLILYLAHLSHKYRGTLKDNVFFLLGNIILIPKTLDALFLRKYIFQVGVQNFSKTTQLRLVSNYSHILNTCISRTYISDFTKNWVLTKWRQYKVDVAFCSPRNQLLTLKKKWKILDFKISRNSRYMPSKYMYWRCVELLFRLS